MVFGVYVPKNQITKNHGLRTNTPRIAVVVEAAVADELAAVEIDEPRNVAGVRDRRGRPIPTNLTRDLGRPIRSARTGTRPVTTTSAWIVPTTGIQTLIRHAAGASGHGAGAAANQAAKLRDRRQAPVAMPART